MATTEVERKNRAGKSKDLERKQNHEIRRRFTNPSRDPYESVEWGIRTAVAGDFRQEGVEAPIHWSDSAVGIVAKLYFATINGKRESSVKTLIRRIVGKITEEGLKHGYFDETGAAEFEAELAYILINQMAAFNSPVWFNLGVPGRKQCCSACYLLNVEDSLVDGGESIADWVSTEAAIFKSGGGAGTNLSKLRGSKEPLSTGGMSSGPISFMRWADAAAGSIKSGGSTRRAAKLVCLDVDHPDILDFIDSKVREDKRMRILMDAGVNLDPSIPEGERNIAECTSSQNANISVRISDKFMSAVENDEDWTLWTRKFHEEDNGIRARDLLNKIAKATWECADPGVMFDDTINKWHTTPSLGKIETSNPCLTGDTLIDTSEGRIKIEDLVTMYATGSKLPLVFAWDIDNKLPKLSKIRKAWMTKIVNEIVEIKTNNGLTFRCTPDHKILVRDGLRSSNERFVEAKDLHYGTRLRKIGRWTNNKRSDRKYINHRATVNSPSGTVYQPKWMWEQANGPIPDGMEIHHINEIPYDDRIANFELIDCHTHKSFHADGKFNSNAYQVDDKTLLEVYEVAENLLKRSPIVTRIAWKKAVEKLGLVGIVPMGNGRGVQGMDWQEFNEWVENHRAWINDTVISVKTIVLDDPEAVYDLEVEGHNFAIASDGIDPSIIVHNCCEVHQNDNTSCNLASLNLIKFLDKDNRFLFKDFYQAVDVMITAMDITCSFSELPTEKFEENTRNLRQLGLGYSNLGAALMIQGMPYDSDEGRDWAASVTSLMTGRAYRRSAELAKDMGAFLHYDDNEEDMVNVIQQHINACQPGIVIAGDKSSIETNNIWHKAQDQWNYIASNHGYGFRNSQVTVIAPTGTISFMMDCDTTGCEPLYSPITYKKLASGGTLEQYSKCYEIASNKIHSEKLDIKILQTASSIGEIAISPEGHIDMIAAIQPHISGAISKTVNIPNESTVDDIYNIYVKAWEKGIKCISIYRDGSKATQILSTDKKSKFEAMGVAENSTNDKIEKNVLQNAEDEAFHELEDKISEDIMRKLEPKSISDESIKRRKMNIERQSITHKFQIGDHEGYVTAGMYPDGNLGEIFLSGIGKEGSTLRGMMDAWAVSVSINLQYGVPLETLAKKFSHMHFDPCGVTNNKEIRTAHSMPDYIMRWLISKFGDKELYEEFGIMSQEVKQNKIDNISSTNGKVAVTYTGKICACGGIMVATGVCYSCPSCGITSGCG